MAKLPEQFLDEIRELLGDGEFEAYLKCFDEPRLYGLRVNTSKISVQDFLKICPFELSPVPWTDNGFYYRGDERVSKHPYYYAGLYYLQEPSAMLPAMVLPVEPGDRVLDTCAAPGGKSTELAAKLNGSGVLFSNDISNSRAQALLKNLELFGTPNAVILSEDLRKMEDRVEGWFDKILIDAPCSGEGMFRKEPAVIKAWVEHGHHFYVSLQKMITASALRMLRPGGKMVYSTCTFSLEEDEEIILYMKSLCPELHVIPINPSYAYSGFLQGFADRASVPDPELRHCVRLFPHHIRGEGHFVCLLQKGTDADTVREARKEGQHREKRAEKVYSVPDDVPPLNGLRILRNGLYLGEEKKDRFEPSQAYAMSLRPDGYTNTVSLPADDIRVIKYLKGETLDLSDRPEIQDGWVLFCTDGYPLGFGKAKNGILKNKYLPGWRMQ
ncbi:MAG: RsmB/NOP family class I SAM-dependent RNA methyltransferase [Lachnospiraceae bacterium]|nr:RsmB/NOP family class I SAM-dependent RNA methyltransferase [Lachnospiraceae bacterium]